MKKFLNVLVICFVMVMPFAVNAAENAEITFSCGAFDSNNERECKVGYKIPTSMSADSVTFTLTEVGGAEILSIDPIVDSDFMLSNTPQEVNGVYTIMLISPDKVTGEHDLITFKYKKSDSPDCGIDIASGDNKVSTGTSDKPTDNVQTGSTLPFIALGAIALIATGAYVSTRKKAKMYKI